MTGISALWSSPANGYFCSGGDLRNIATVDLDNQGWRNRLQDLHEWLQDLLTLDRPVIAAVDGVAYGAGFSLALMADFVLATLSARFCMSFMRVGLVPDCGAFYTLPRIVGVQAFFAPPIPNWPLSNRNIGSCCCPGRSRILTKTDKDITILSRIEVRRDPERPSCHRPDVVLIEWRCIRDGACSFDGGAASSASASLVQDSRGGECRYGPGRRAALLVW